MQPWRQRPPSSFRPRVQDPRSRLLPRPLRPARAGCCKPADRCAAFFPVPTASCEQSSSKEPFEPALYFQEHRLGFVSTGVHFNQPFTLSAEKINQGRRLALVLSQPLPYNVLAIIVTNYQFG